jgi:hypothetical protein
MISIESIAAVAVVARAALPRQSSPTVIARLVGKNNQSWKPKRRFSIANGISTTPWCVHLDSQELKA